MNAESLSLRRNLALDFVFIVLVYRNTCDLRDFFINFNVPNSKVIVINSFYDKETEIEFRQVAKSNNADFLNVENKGYGAGNNRGIEYALEHYNFRYLVISNADITIEKMIAADVIPNVINAPKIITLSGKNQNPHTPYHIKWIDKCKYLAFTKFGKKILFFPLGINKLLKQLFYFVNGISLTNTIYAPHGAFIVFPKRIVEMIHPIFDENMFLFCEEDVLAYKAQKQDIKILYNPRIIIQHKEDGSVSSISDQSFNILTKSNVYYYETYIKD